MKDLRMPQDALKCPNSLLLKLMYGHPTRRQAFTFPYAVSFLPSFLFFPLALRKKERQTDVTGRRLVGRSVAPFVASGWVGRIWKLAENNRYEGEDLEGRGERDRES